MFTQQDIQIMFDHFSTLHDEKANSTKKPNQSVLSKVYSNDASRTSIKINRVFNAFNGIFNSISFFIFAKFNEVFTHWVSSLESTKMKNFYIIDLFIKESIKIHLETFSGKLDRCLCWSTSLCTWFMSLNYVIIFNKS